jgi:archaellum component FlaF (FlaF/FlaG flagellin family)
MKNTEEILHKMQEVNPDVKMDYNFKKSLKNKLEVTSYAKIKNTKNKKVNIAKNGFFSFKKTNSNIFEKPKINFLKIISPIFI